MPYFETIGNRGSRYMLNLLLVRLWVKRSEGRLCWIKISKNQLEFVRIDPTPCHCYARLCLQDISFHEEIGPFNSVDNSCGL